MKYEFGFRFSRCGDQNELTSQNGKCIVEDLRKYKCIKPYEDWSVSFEDIYVYISFQLWQGVDLCAEGGNSSLAQFTQDKSR